MAVITAYLGASALVAQRGAGIVTYTGYGDQYLPTYPWNTPFLGSLGPLGYTPTNNLPIDVEPRAVIQGFVGRTFKQDYYDRYIIRPSSIDVGNLLSAQQRNVEVWNGFEGPKLLNQVQQSGTDGITLVEPVPAPTTFAGLESRTYTLNISTNGAPVIDAKYTFDFEGTTDPILSVIGKRVVVWPFMPQTRHKETLEWLTDIIQSYSNEQRIALRAAPRQSIAYDFLMDDGQLSRAKAITNQWSQRVYGVPIWAEASYLGGLLSGITRLTFDTTNCDYRQNDIILVWRDDGYYDAVETLAVTSTYIDLKLPLPRSYTTAYVCPLRFARTLEGASFRRQKGNINMASLEFQVTQNADLAAASTFPQYRSYDVLNVPSVLTSNLNERVYRDVDVIDNNQGPLTIDATTGYVTHAQTITFDGLTRAERWAHRTWMHSRRGRQKGFWLPSWNKDVVILSDTAAPTTTLTVQAIGYPLYYGVRDIMLVLKNGNVYYRRVLSGSTDVNGNETLSLDASFGVAFLASDVALCCFMTYVRFNTDSIEIEHGYAGRATTAVPVIETAEGA